MGEHFWSTCKLGTAEDGFAGYDVTYKGEQRTWSATQVTAMYLFPLACLHFVYVFNSRTSLHAHSLSQCFFTASSQLATAVEAMIIAICLFKTLTVCLVMAFSSLQAPLAKCRAVPLSPTNHRSHLMSRATCSAAC